MKKLLGVLISLSIACTPLLSVNADSKDDLLIGLGILQGDENGDLQLEKELSRAEFTAIVTRTLNAEVPEKSTTNFSDVDESHWASGYIATCAQLGLINGFEDGTFRPEENVTYEQAAKVVCCALGYDVLAEKSGGYPSGYLNIVASEKINKNVSVAIGKPILRKDLAQLIYNALNSQLFKADSWNSNGETSYTKSDDTLLSKVFDVDVWHGVVYDAPILDGYDNTNFTLSIDGYKDTYNDGVYAKDYDNITVNTKEDLSAYLGTTVIAYVNEDDDLISVAEDTKTSNLYLSVSDIAEAGYKYADENGKIYYYENNSSKPSYLKLDENVISFINYKEVNIYNTLDLLSYVENGNIQFIDNNDDNKIDYIIGTSYTNEAVVKAIDIDDEYITFDAKGAGILSEIDLTEDTVKVFKNGKEIDPYDISINDTVTEIEMETFRILYISDKTITGSVTSYDIDEDTVTIAGESYELSPFFNESPEDLLGESGTFYLNVDGKIVYNDTTSGSIGTNYGLVLSTGYTSDEEYTVKVVTSKGTNKYTLASKAKLYDGKTLIADSDEEVYEYLQTALGGTKLQKSNVNSALFDITLRGNEITKLNLFEGSTKTYDSSNSKVYDAENMSYGASDFNESTLVFSICNDATVITDSDIEIGSVDNFFNDKDEDLDFIALTEKDEDEVTIVIGYNFDRVVEDNNVFIVTSISNIEYQDDDALLVSGLQKGKSVSFTFYNDYKDLPSLDKGDVLLLGNSKEDVVKDFDVLFKSAEAIQIGNRVVDAKYNKFYLAEDIDNYPAEDGITIKSNITYTLVDYSSGGKVNIKSKTGSKSLFTEGTESFVYVYQYDDEIKDIVIFRY